MCASTPIKKQLVHLLLRLRVPNQICYILVLLEEVLAAIYRILLKIIKGPFVKIEKVVYRGLKEEWQYFECKITIVVTSATVLVIYFFLATGYTLPFSESYSIVFASFASFVAIIPAVSLAVIEISSSGYSVKLARVYRRSFYFWYLLAIDMLVILVSGIGLLYPNSPILKTITPILAFFGIVYLVPYFQAMMRLLDPKKAIATLGQQINLESLLSIVKHETIGPVPPPEDPIFPLIGIGFKAIKERDLEMLQLSLEEIGARYRKVLLSLESSRPKRESSFGEVFREVMATGRMRKIIDHFMNHLRSLKQFAFDQKYELAVACAIEYFAKLAEQTMQYKFIESHRGDNLPSFEWIYEIFQLGKESLIYSFWDGTASSLRALSYLSRIAMQNEYDSLQDGIARLIVQLSTISMRAPTLPLHFIPGVVLSCMSDVVKHRMEFGIYDYSLEYEIESMNLLSKEVVTKADPFSSGQILSGCYEKTIAVALLDFYVSKNIKPNIVAKVIYDVLPFKHLHAETLFQLVNDRSKRRLFFRPSEYSPKKALEDLIRDGLRQVSVESIGSKKYFFEHSARSTLMELSRVFYEFKDADFVGEVSQSLLKTYFSSKDPNDFHVKEIVETVFALYYACIRTALIPTASDLILSLKKIALFAAERQLRDCMPIAMLIDYAGAVAIDMNLPSLANQALDSILEFEEYCTKKGTMVPGPNHMRLLIRDYPVRFLSYSKDEPYIGDTPRSWLYRLFRPEIETAKRLVTGKAIGQFYTLYLFQKLPLH